MSDITAMEIVDTVRDGLLVLDDDLTVESANQSYFRTFEVDPDHTIGAKIFDLGNGQWDIPDLRHLLERIVPEHETVEAFRVIHEFETIGRRVMLLNARTVYREGNGSRRILLAIADITEADDLARELERQKRLADGIVETVREFLLVLDGDLNVIAASRSFYTNFSTRAADTIGRNLADLCDRQWDIEDLHVLLQEILPANETIEDYEFQVDFRALGTRSLLLNARQIYRKGNKARTILLAMEDVTKQKSLEAERAAALKRSENLLDELNHRVMNSMAVIGSIISLEARNMPDSQCKEAFSRVSGRFKAISRLYRNLSKSDAVDTVEADAYLGMIAEEVINSLAAGGSQVSLSVDAARVPLSTRIAVPLGLILNELVTNSVKYAFAPGDEGRVSVAFSVEGSDATFSVSDSGRGIDPDAATDSGLGARFIDAFVQQLSGTIDRQSGDTGTRIQVNFPLA